MTEPAIDVVHVGSACRDLTDDDPRGWRLGGGATFSALTTARLGLRTGAVVGVDAIAGTAGELDLLRAAGVEVVLVPLAEGPVFVNRDTPVGRVQTCVATGRPVPVSSMPDRWRSTPIWSLVPVAAEIDDAWLSIVPDAVRVSLGWQGLLRRLVAGEEVTRLAPGASRLTVRADLVGVSRHDLAPGTRPTTLLSLLRPGAHLVVTDGLAGGRVLVRRMSKRIGTRRYGAVAADREVDPTGAGDVFLAALVTALARGRDDFGASRSMASALRFAATAASFVVEAPGPDGVPELSAVLARLDRANDPVVPSS